MTRVLIVDDDPLVRRLLTTVLTAQGVTVVGEATDGDEVVDAVSACHPDVVLLDLTMRRMGGRDALAALRRAGHRTAVVVLTSFGTEEMVLEMLRAGAAGFLGKDDDPDAMASQIEAAAAGRPVVGQQALGVLVRHAADPAPVVDHAACSALAALTVRERDVVAWLPHGWTNPQIAARLYLSESTVKTHLSSAMAKLGLTSREQVAVLVDRAGLTASG